MLGGIGERLIKHLVTIEATTTIEPELRPRLSDRPMIVVANHASFFDPVVVAYSCHKLFERRVAFAGKQSVFEIPVVGWLARLLGHIPIAATERHAPLSTGGSYRKLLVLLRRNEWIGLFPEGDIPEEGERVAIRSGFLRLALEAEVAVLRVRIANGEALGRRHVDWTAVRRAVRRATPITITLSLCEPGSIALDDPEAHAERIYREGCTSD